MSKLGRPRRAGRAASTVVIGIRITRAEEEKLRAAHREVADAWPDFSAWCRDILLNHAQVGVNRGAV